MNAPILKDAYKVGSPVNIPIDFKNDSDFCHINLYVWTGDFDAYPDVEESQPTFLIKVKRDDKVSYKSCDISSFIKPYIKPVFNINSDEYFRDFFAYFMYSYDYYLNGAYVRSVSLTDIKLACLGYSFSRNHYNSNMANDAPYLADGSVNNDFDLDNYNSLKYKKPLIGGTSNIYYRKEDLNATISSSEDNGKLSSLMTDVPKDIGVCNPNAYQILFLDKNGLIDFFTITGRVTEGVEYSRDNYSRLIYNTNRSFSSNRTNNSNGVRYFNINTGKLHPVMSNKIEELLLSEYIILYSHKAMAFYDVYITDSDVRLRNTVNDKSNITYNLKLKESLKMKL